MQLKDQIKKLISEGKTEQALELLNQFAKEKGGLVEQKAILLSSQFRKWRSERMAGIESSSSEIRRIEYNILEVLEFQDLPPLTASAAVPAAKKSNTPLLVAILIGVAAVALGGMYLFTSSAKASEGDAATGEEYVNQLASTGGEDTGKVAPRQTVPANDKSADDLAELPEQPEVAPPYSVVDLAGKTWTAENLNIDIPGSLCYQDDEYNCGQTGHLYTWSQAKRACNKLGDGWRLPTDADWKDLTRMYGGAYGDLSSDGTQVYQHLSKGGSTGFNAQMGGKRIYFPDQQVFDFYDFNTVGYYWADMAKVDDPAQAIIYTFRSTDDMVIRESIPNTDFLACRCVKD